MATLVISTDRLVSSSEARQKFGKLIAEVSANKGNYFVILDNGKVAALLVNPDWLKGKQDEEFPDLERLREDWSRYTENISEAMDHLMDLEEKQLPPLLRSKKS